MAFRGEVQHRARSMRLQQGTHRVAVGDVLLRQDGTAALQRRRDRRRVAGVGQLVEHDHALVVCREPVMDEVAADEAGAAGDEDHEICHAGAGRHPGEGATRVWIPAFAGMTAVVSPV